MLKKTIVTLLIAFPLTTLAVNASEFSLQDLPQKAMDYLHKHHPKAKDFSVKEKKHFGQSFYQVSFKESKFDKNNTPYDEEIGELFRPNGYLFTNIVTVEKHAFNIISEDAMKSLQTNYPKHKLLGVKMITNPNDYGEEYDIELLASGKVWEITVNNNGEILSETEKR